MKPQQHISTTVPEMGKAQTPCSENPEWFYNENLWPAAKRTYCDGCPLRAPCLEEALRSEAASPWKHRYGLWSGTTPEERRIIAAKRAKRERLKMLMRHAEGRAATDARSA